MTYFEVRRELRCSADPLTYSCLIGKTDLISIPDRLYVGAFLTVDRSDRQLRSLRPTPTESEIRNLSLGPIPTGSLKSRSDRAEMATIRSERARSDLLPIRAAQEACSDWLGNLT